MKALQYCIWVVISLVIVLAFVLWQYFPQYPLKWNDVRIGMSEIDVNKALRGSYSSPIGLEQEGARLESYDYYYGLGQWVAIYGNEYTLKVTYDRIGGERDYSRRVVGIKIDKHEKSLKKYLLGLWNWIK
jgi:hypothetical protein